MALRPTFVSVTNLGFGAALVAIVFGVSMTFASCGDEGISVEHADTNLDDAEMSRAAWEEIAVPLTPRVQPALVTTDDGLLVVGGVEPYEFDCPSDADCAAPEQRPLVDGAALHAPSATWSDIAPSPRPLWRPSAATWTGTEFITFGAAYNVEQKSWRELPPPPFLAYDDLSWTGDVVTTTGWDYDRGERNGVGQYVGAALNPADATWRVQAWTHEPPGVESARSVTVGGKVMAFVLTDLCTESGPPCRRVVEWDPGRDAWKDVTELPGATHVATLDDSRVLVASEDNVYFLDAASGSTTDLPSPGVGYITHIATSDNAIAVLGLEGVAAMETRGAAWRRFDRPPAEAIDLSLYAVGGYLLVWQGAAVGDDHASVWRMRL